MLKRRLTLHTACLMAACLLALVGVHGPAHAQATRAYTPRSDAQIVEVLRERPLDAQEKQWRALRAQLRAQPNDAALAIKVSKQALQWARQDGDPRWMGQAQAALNAWWAQSAPPPEIRLLRATILQSTHDFDAALRDLRALVALEPGNAQAWLTLGSVLQVTGRYAEAQNACEQVLKAGAPWHGQVCALELRSLRGQAGEAQSALATLAQRAPIELKSYINLVRAELAERQGQTSLAQNLYQDLMSQDPDAYTEGAYADFLLDQHKPQEVIARLKDKQRNDALLLRLAQAYADQKDPALEAAVQALRARFAAARERGDSVHRREEARFTLHLLKQPQAALKLAKANWQVQKEAADARILLEAARAAQDEAASGEVRRFIQEAGWSDARLGGLL